MQSNGSVRGPTTTKGAESGVTYYRPISDLHREWDRDCVLRNRATSLYSISHLETDKDTILGIAGDIDTKKNSIKFLEEISPRFKAVVVVLGNHDYWRRDFQSWADTIQSTLIQKGCSNVFVLNRESVKIEGIRFIGATLWTDFNKGDSLLLDSASRIMNDYRFMRKDNYARRVLPKDLLGEYRKSHEYIFSFAENKERMVVLSHHAPSFQSIDYSRYRADDVINHLYATELGNEIAYSNFELWHHGHVHTSFNYMIHNTKIICNPRGYFMYGMNPNFNDQLLIKLT